MEERCLLSSGLTGSVRERSAMSVTLKMTPQSNPDGNGIITRNRVVVEGQTQPFSKVKIFEKDGSVVVRSMSANAHGQFRLMVPVAIGTMTMDVIATNPKGESASTSMEMTRGDVVIAWNRTAIDVIRAANANVGMASRNFAIVQGAVYDAINSIDHAHASYKFDVHAPKGASPEAAASEAAYQVLLALYPDAKKQLKATLDQTLATVPHGLSRVQGLAVGKEVAMSYLAWRMNDGSSADPVYKVGTAPGQWRPTPPDFRNAWGPAWGQVTPFAIPAPTAFLPPPPPALNRPEYAAAVNQVESLGAANSTTRTADQTQIADFWAYDVNGYGPPPILYNEVAEQIALQQHNTLDQNARMFAMADVAMADAGIVAWDSKYIDNFWRPITAIREANTDGNPATIADPTWTPLGAPGHGVLPNFTPPFPSYVSGHATFGAALFQVLADFYGTDNVHFTLTSDELPGVTRSYQSFSQAAEENGMSRIYLGIHYVFDKTAGIASGDAIGNYVANNVMQ
jgi:hypothetical protein